MRDVIKNEKLAQKLKPARTKEDVIKVLTEESEFERADKELRSPLTRLAENIINVTKGFIIKKRLEKEQVKEEHTDVSVSEIPKKKEIEVRKPKREWVKTGVPGFDELIARGIPKGSSVLLAGGPGSGKTTFALQTVSYAAANGEKCLYLTFEEDKERLEQHMSDYNWNPKKLQEEGNLIIKKMDPFQVGRSVEALLAKASGELVIELDLSLIHI